MPRIAIAEESGSSLERSTAAAVIGVDEVSRRRICDVLTDDGVEVWAEAAEALGIEPSSHRNGPGIAIIVDAGARLAVNGQVRQLEERLPKARVIVVAADAGSGAVQAALRAGVAGFVPFTHIEVALPATVRAVAAGQLTVPREQRASLERQPLTAREKQTLALVVMGLTNCQIAAKLYLAESTVKSHLSSAFNKLGVRSRNEAVAMILDPNSGVGTGILTIPTQGP